MPINVVELSKVIPSKFVNVPELLYIIPPLVPFSINILSALNVELTVSQLKFPLPSVCKYCPASPSSIGNDKVTSLVNPSGTYNIIFAFVPSIVNVPVCKFVIVPLSANKLVNEPVGADITPEPVKSSTFTSVNYNTMSGNALVNLNTDEYISLYFQFQIGSGINYTSPIGLTPSQFGLNIYINDYNITINSI